MKVQCEISNGVATFHLDIRDRAGVPDENAWRKIQADHDKGWQSVGLWALSAKRLHPKPRSKLRWTFDRSPYIAHFKTRVDIRGGFALRQTPLLAKALRGARQFMRDIAGPIAGGYVMGNAYLGPDTIRKLVLTVVQLSMSGNSQAMVAVRNAMMLSWCLRSLGLPCPLLRHFTTHEEYVRNAKMYRCLDEIKFPQIFICTNLKALRRRDFLQWVCSAGVSGETITSIINPVEQNEVPKRAQPCRMDTESVEGEQQGRVETTDLSETRYKSLSEIRKEIACRNADSLEIEKTKSIDSLKLKDVILQEYPHGIVFSNSTIALLERFIAQRLSEWQIERVRHEMFSRDDGMLLYPEMVMDGGTFASMKGRAEELLAEHGMFAYESLRAEFEGCIHNLEDIRDFGRFFDRFIGCDVGATASSRDRLGRMMCFGSVEDGAKKIGEKIRGVLAECGDAMSIDDLLVRLPYLSREVIEYAGQEILDDVIEFEFGGEKFLKLLESYYLPDDFSNVISDFVEATENSRGVVSIVLLEAELERRYGEGFRVNFALEDDSVFKQVVLKSFQGVEHCWRGDVFSAVGVNVSRNVADEFVSIRKGVFHEDEFFAFALEKRGLNNHASLVCQYLRTRCIRLNRSMWISVDDFRDRGILDVTLRDQVEALLKEQLGTSAILHIGLIPEMALASIPPIVIEGKEYPWNAYSITSVGKHLIDGLNIVNDEPSPYYVTAILLPDGIEVSKENVVEHVFDVCKDSGMTPSSADEAFEYLKAKLVRMTKTKKLMKKINSYWGF